MMEITAEIRALIDKAAVGMELAGDEYIDPADGLIHCKKCGGQRQTVVPCFGKSGYFMPRCICQCQREAEEQRKAAEERQRRITKHKRYKELSDFDKKNAFDVERYLKHELRLRMDEEFDCYEVDVSEESTA